MTFRGCGSTVPFRGFSLRVVTRQKNYEEVRFSGRAGNRRTKQTSRAMLFEALKEIYGTMLNY